MGYVFYNPNPVRKTAGDCVIRSICKLTGKEWEEAYWDVCLQGFMDKEMPSANEVWGAYLYKHGYRRYMLPDNCPMCYTVEDFCQDHPYGSYLLATGSHVVAVVEGDYFDTWDSGNEVPMFYWTDGR